MSNLYISGHYPAINEQDVPTNPTIRIIFNTEIKTDSIDYKVLSVHDKLYATVPGTLGWDYTNKGTPSGIANILTFTPSVLLSNDTEYSVYVHKKPDSVVSKYNEQLDDTYKFTFTTGIVTLENPDPTPLDKLYEDLERAIADKNWELAAQIQEMIDQIENGIIPSGEIPSDELPETIPSLNIISTNPYNTQPNVKDMKFIELNFNDIVEDTGIALGDYISVTAENVLS